MEQTKALNALAPFLALTKLATTPRAAARVIEQATSASNTYIFTELLEAAEIRALSDSDSHSSYLKLLEIFSFGTYNTYISTSSLPKLNETQTTKLRQLSFLTLARNPENLSYANLKRELGVEEQHELENLFISIVYAGLVEGTLDPYHQRVVIKSISSLRDLEPNSIPNMINTLGAWSSRCMSTLEDLEQHIACIKTEALRRHRYETAWASEFDRLTSEITNKHEKEPRNFNLLFGNSLNPADVGAGKRGGDVLDDHLDEAMDIDDEEVNERRDMRSAKKRGLDAR
ncbi:unnamed protein product [Blumeria hordei]|uniref:PCI domain-containing protein n=1 Tax=Blumeria hordei TaxID=2867405 RepID=A0A383UNE7_BLUHO|nr:unnamed protein product [Blumeria hordei]